MIPVIDWMAATALAGWVVNTPWVWPTLETLHFVGLCLVLGPLLIIDLRLAGALRDVRADALLRLLPLVGGGFCINAATGIAFVFGDPSRYLINGAFQLKLLLVVLAGINAVWFAVRMAPAVEAHAGSAPARAAGLLSLGLWFGILAAGRLIPYVSTG